MFLTFRSLVLDFDNYLPITAANKEGGEKNVAPAGLEDVTTKQRFHEIVASGVTVVDFWAPWCRNCKKVTPLITRLSQELSNIKFIKVNTVEAEELSNELKVEALPTFQFYKNGQLVGDFKGTDGAKLEQAIRLL